MITLAMIVSLIMPPEEYRYEPTRPYEVIEVVDNRFIDAICGVEGMVVLGCVNPSLKKPVIWLRNNLSPSAKEKVLVHEKAHINGWTHE